MRPKSVSGTKTCFAVPPCLPYVTVRSLNRTSNKVLTRNGGNRALLLVKIFTKPTREGDCLFITRRFAPNTDSLKCCFNKQIFRQRLFKSICKNLTTKSFVCQEKFEFLRKNV